MGFNLQNVFGYFQTRAKSLRWPTKCTSFGLNIYTLHHTTVCPKCVGYFTAFGKLNNSIMATIIFVIKLKLPQDVTHLPSLYSM